MLLRNTILAAIFLATPPAQATFYENPFALAATVAGTVVVSKFAYDTISLIDTYQLPNLYEKLFVRKQMVAPAPTINVGFLKIDGFINDVQQYIEKIETYKNDPTIQGLLVTIFSTGGCAGSSELLYRELVNFRKYKPVVVYIDTVCLSAGYMVACGADYIITTSAACVGGIGTIRTIKHFIENPKYTSDEEEGVLETSYIKAGKYKAVGNPYSPLTESEKSYFQELVNKDYDIFCRMVADARGLSFAERDTWANGKEFIAEDDALKLGLIDGFGSWTDAGEKILELIMKKDPNAHGPLKIVAI